MRRARMARCRSRCSSEGRRAKRSASLPACKRAGLLACSFALPPCLPPSLPLPLPLPVPLLSSTQQATNLDVDNCPRWADLAMEPAGPTPRRSPAQQASARSARRRTSSGGAGAGGSRSPARSPASGRKSPSGTKMTHHGSSAQKSPEEVRGLKGQQGQPNPPRAPRAQPAARPTNRTSPPPHPGCCTHPLQAARASALRRHLSGESADIREGEIVVGGPRDGEAAPPLPTVDSSAADLAALQALGITSPPTP